MMHLSELVVDPFADVFGDDDVVDDDSQLISHAEAQAAGRRSVTEVFEAPESGDDAEGGLFPPSA